MGYEVGPKWDNKLSHEQGILIYQGVRCCTKVDITDCKGSDTTWEFRMWARWNMFKFLKNAGSSSFSWQYKLKQV